VQCGIHEGILYWASLGIARVELHFAELILTQNKTKILAFKGKQLVRSKIEIEGSILEKSETI